MEQGVRGSALLCTDLPAFHPLTRIHTYIIRTFHVLWVLLVSFSVLFIRTRVKPKYLWLFLLFLFATSPTLTTIRYSCTTTQFCQPQRSVFVARFIQLFHLTANPPEPPHPSFCPCRQPCAPSRAFFHHSSRSRTNLYLRAAAARPQVN